MKGLGTSIAPIHAGIKYDLDQMLMKFKECGSVRFREFSKVFRDLEMHLIYYGRQNCAELVEFTERLLQIAVSYLAPTKTFSSSTGFQALEPTDPDYEYTNRIFGVYVCYAFFYVQPKDYVSQIRITPAQMNSVTQFIQLYLLPESHYDTLACLYKLVDDSAFKIVMFETCFDPVTHKRYDMPDTDELCNDAPEPQFNLAKSLVDDPLLAQIELVHKKYAQGKENLKVGMKLPKDPLEICRNLYGEAQKRFQDEIKTAETIMLDPSSQELKPTVPRSSIKEKAYSSKIQHSRNRRYADPEMEENFGELVTNQGEEMELHNSPNKTKKGRRSRNLPSTSTVMEDKDKTLDMLVQDIQNSPRKRNRRKTVEQAGLEERSSTQETEDSDIFNYSFSESPAGSKKKGKRLPARPILPSDFEVTKMLETPSFLEDINIDDLRAD